MAMKEGYGLLCFLFMLLLLENWQSWSEKYGKELKTPPLILVRKARPQQQTEQTYGA